MKRTFYTIGSLIILLICAFVFVALPAMVGKSNPNELPPFGKYDGKEIRYEQDSDFANFVQQYGQYYQSMGYQIDNSMYFNIFRYAFDATVTKMTAVSTIAKSGWKPSVEAINRTMRPYFYDESGNYSSKLYKQTPDSTITKMRNEITTSLITQRFNDDFFGSDSESVGSDTLYGLKESDKELDFLAGYGKTKRGFDMALFTRDDYPYEEKVAFGKANISKFVKYDMSVITVEGESEAKKIAKRLANEEISFDDAVSEYSTKTYSNTEGKLNLNYGYQLNNAISDDDDFITLCGLSNGQISDVIETVAGYSIYRVDGAPENPNFEDENIINAIYSYMTSYESSVIENYYISQAKDFIADASLKGFYPACIDAGIFYYELDPLPLNYGNVAISDTLNTTIQGLSNAATNENFLTTAFTLKLNEFSEPIVVDSNIIVLQYTKEETSEDTADVLSQLPNFDQESASNVIMSSPKVENHLLEVYFNNFL